MDSRFFERLVPVGGNLNESCLSYESVRALTTEFRSSGKSLFDQHPRVLVAVILSECNFLLAEVRSGPEQEIVLYDSDRAMFQVFHQRIVGCLR